MKPRQIIAIGGQGFARKGEKPRMEAYILAQANVQNPRIAFLGTATGDAPRYIEFFHATFSRLRCKPSHVPLFARTPDLRKALLTQDVIFVGGGNTKSMLAVWKDWGIDTILKEAWKKGIVLAGVSAGAICWFAEGSTDSWEDDLHAIPCLGFLKGSCCPHYSGEPDRRPSYHTMLKTKKIGSGIAIDDFAAAHYVGTKLLRVVTLKKGHSATFVEESRGEIGEEPLEAEVLL